MDYRELLELIWVLEHTIEREPKLKDFLDNVVASPVFQATDLPRPREDERKPPKREAEAAQEGLPSF